MKKLYVLLVLSVLLFPAGVSAATTLYMRGITHSITGDGANRGRALAIGRGASNYNAVKSTFAGDNAEGPYNSTSQFTAITANPLTQIWISNPLSADATIAGTVTFNLWAFESATNKNACITADLVRLSAAGNVQSVIATAVRRAEMTGSSTVQNWTRTPTSTTVYAGERIGLRVYIDDGTGVTMATSGTVTMPINGATPGASGDSYVTVTENLSFADDIVLCIAKPVAYEGDTQTLASCGTNQAADLVTNKWISKIELYAMNDTTAFSLSSSTWTANDTYYPLIYTPSSERHSGAWDDTKYRLQIAGTAITLGPAKVVLDGLQISVTAASVNNRYGIYATTGSSQIDVSNCIIKGIVSGTASIVYGISVSNTNANVRVWNTVFDNFINGTNDVAAVYASSGTKSFSLYNNTIHNAYVGVKNSTTGGTQVMVNNLIAATTTAATGTFEAPTDHNATNNAGMNYTVTGEGNTHDRLSQTFSFMDEAADNFHLLYADAGAKEYGMSDPGSGLFSDDIDGQSRPIDTSWDIGADETDPSAAPPSTVGGRFFLMFP